MIGRRRLMAIGAGAMALTAALRPRAAGNPPPELRWAVDYGPASVPAVARTYDLLVLEPHHARPIAPLRGPGARLLGYVSFGEVEKQRPYFADLETAGALGPPNPNWPDARFVDLRHPAWTAAIVDTIVPQMLEKGYDGILIDTMDNAEAMERQDPTSNRGMIQAGAALIAAVRARFPAIRIMLNRGYALLDTVAPRIDHVLGEAMATRWNFTTRTYEPLSDGDWQWQADRLRRARTINPGLALHTLDYWEPTDTKAIAALYARERAAGFLPYVSTLALDRLWPESRG